MGKIIRAVAGVLYDKKHHSVLITSRPQGKVYEGYWEFPGGKIEVGEAPLDALARELLEEIGVVVNKDACSQLTTLTTEYPHGTVSLAVFVISNWSGDAANLEQQSLHWHNLNESCAQQPLLITTDNILKLLQQHVKLKFGK